MRPDHVSILSRMAVAKARKWRYACRHVGASPALGTCCLHTSQVVERGVARAAAEQEEVQGDQVHDWQHHRPPKHADAQPGESHEEVHAALAGAGPAGTGSLSAAAVARPPQAARRRPRARARRRRVAARRAHETFLHNSSGSRTSIPTKSFSCRRTISTLSHTIRKCETPSSG